MRDAGTEVPERATVILRALTEAGARVVPSAGHDAAALLAVHDQALVEHLATIWADWEAAGYPADYGRDRVVPYVFPTAAMLAGLPARTPAATHAQVGRYCYDTMTLIGPGSWEAIRAAADCAQTAADLVSSGAPAAYALCRPPGHHAGPAGYGGSCYLNNAAVAAQALRQRWGRARRRDRHRRPPRQRHAGDLLRPRRTSTTEACMWTRVPAGSRTTWVSPTREGTGPARAPTATSRSRPAPATTPGSTRSVCCATTSAAYGAQAIVLSLGVDAAAADPESPLQVTADGYRAAGELIGSLGPVAAVQEGGYDLASLGDYVLAAQPASPPAARLLVRELAARVRRRGAAANS